MQVATIDSNDKTVMTTEEVAAFLESEFPEASYLGKTYEVLEITNRGGKIRLFEHERHIRPGGTMSGPAMMALADIAAYLILMGNIGPVALAVTTSLNINFVRKPAPGDLIADGEIIKLGRSLAVFDVRIRSVNSDALVAQASVTYAIPKQ
jgi:uncharacterized protein (TIGR00369 family)